ncbi:hypothetical protein [Aureispira sp. CCB-QB1]|uniref:hypothetical protein n=1 Tax=Aureispira sp. CCB-QB1 TaxID=1313421 RepID=UPI000696DF89|nr:hypothetical protein [Aureispira sp. CCB-QB1]
MQHIKLIFIFYIFVLSSAKSQIIDSNTLYINNLNDTIFLAPIVPHSFCVYEKIEIIDSIQINGIGAKEVVIYRKCSADVQKEGGTFSIREKVKIGKIEVWDVDAKELLFEGTTSLDKQYFYSDAYQNSPNSEGFCAYQYSFKINSKGIINIKKELVESNPEYDDTTKNYCPSNLKEGIYHYTKNGYEKKQSN